MMWDPFYTFAFCQYILSAHVSDFQLEKKKLKQTKQNTHRTRIECALINGTISVGPSVLFSRRERK